MQQLCYQPYVFYEPGGHPAVLKVLVNETSGRRLPRWESGILALGSTPAIRFHLITSLKALQAEICSANRETVDKVNSKPECHPQEEERGSLSRR